MSEETRRRLLAVARRVRVDGPLHPLVVVEGADDEPALFFDANTFWGEQRQRRRVMGSLGGTLGYGVDAQRIYVVVEVWLAEEDLRNATEAEVEAFQERIRAGDFVAPRDRPDRLDAIQVMELTRTETPAGMLTQTFKRRKGKLKWAEPRVWKGEHVEDFTFGAFWEGLRQTEAIKAALVALQDDLEVPEAEAQVRMRRAARRSAVALFGQDLFEEHEIGRVLRRWKQR